MFPGVPVLPSMASGATDCRFLTPAGVPCYGVSGMLSDGATSNAHGLNERIRVQTLIEGPRIPLSPHEAVRGRTLGVSNPS